MTNSYFFIGVAGVGMSAIAQYLVGKGVAVSGSDRQFGEFLNGKAEKPLVMSQLEDCGIKCFAQDGSGVVEGLTAVVVSTAIEDSNPDLKRAKELGVPVMHRSEMLAKISKEARNAVSGKGEWLVAEVDESDGTLVRYEPEIGVILNIDKDHKEISELEQIFLKFSQNVLSAGHILIVNDAHPLAKKFSAGREFDFGYESYVSVQGIDFKSVGTHIQFRVRHGNELVKFEIPLPGKHNMENALAATAAALRAGVSLHTCADALSSFPGVFRRHQILGTFNGITLVDDFAHNPAKIAASIKSAQDFTEGRVIAWFQPHGFGPTRFLRKDLVDFIAKTLRPMDMDFDRKNDVMFFSEIYYAGGTVTRDISAGDLADDLILKGCEAIYIADRNECAKKMLEYAEPGDTILLMGARDPSLQEFARSVKQLLENR